MHMHTHCADPNRESIVEVGCGMSMIEISSWHSFYYDVYKQYLYVMMYTNAFV